MVVLGGGRFHVNEKVSEVFCERSTPVLFHTHTREHREGSAVALTFGFPEEPIQPELDSYMTVLSDPSYQSTLDAVYVYVVPWSEFSIVPSYPHYPQKKEHNYRKRSERTKVTPRETSYTGVPRP